MATKKQKHEAALNRRKEFLEREKISGLAARSKALSDRMEESLKAEIVAMSERFGERVRIAEDSALEPARRMARAEWMRFLADLTKSPHRSDALTAYNNAYSGPDPALEDPCPSWCIVHRSMDLPNPSAACSDFETKRT